jgi:hypothetical protein
MEEIDSGFFLSVYPETAGTKLDNCSLCHSGGSYQDSKGKTVSLGSCQWCHYTYGYDASGNIDDTLNAYGLAFKSAGRSADAVRTIESEDSDGDGFLNGVEIAAQRFPGDPNDTPAKVPAPYRVYSREGLEELPQHTQFQLMNTHKSADFYASYTGVPLGDLLEGMLLDSATGIMVYAPDGWAQYHPLSPDPNPLFYHVLGEYPAAPFHYAEEADLASNPTHGWCDYSAPSTAGRSHGEAIQNPQGLKLLLAYKRDGQYLTPGVLNLQNKLDGEGPFRIVPPQKDPTPPDQKSTAASVNPTTGEPWIWPFVFEQDHNAGYSSRTATIIKVEPLPEGTTDIDILEAGWNFVDQNKIIVYGAIDPRPTILDKLEALVADVEKLDKSAFRNRGLQRAFIHQLKLVRNLVAKGRCRHALKHTTTRLMPRVDGCAHGEAPDRLDSIRECDAQKRVYWGLNEIGVLLKSVPENAR